MCNLVYAYRMENCTQEEAEEFLTELAAPLSTTGRW